MVWVSIVSGVWVEPGRKRIWCTLKLWESHWWQSFLVFWSACFIIVTYQEYPDGVCRSPRGGAEPARPPSKSTTDYTWHCCCIITSEWTSRHQQNDDWCLSLACSVWMKRVCVVHCLCGLLSDSSHCHRHGNWLGEEIIACQLSYSARSVQQIAHPSWPGSGLLFRVWVVMMGLCVSERESKLVVEWKLALTVSHLFFIISCIRCTL